MKKIYTGILLILPFMFVVFAANAQTISALTYPFTTSNGVALEDLSSGATILVAANNDDGASTIANIGFDYWFNGIHYTQFGASANGYIRMGAVVSASGSSTDYTNSLAVNQAPVIAPYWDDLYTGTNGSVRYKVLGTAPNRKLVVEWQNEQIPRVGAGTAGAGNFQLWLYETSGIINYVYGTGMAVNTTNLGASIGFATAPTNYASITLNATSTSSTVSYSTAVNDLNTIAITSGTAFAFTPLIPADPTGLNFTGITQTAITLNWNDIASNEVGYAIFRSTDGVNYTFANQSTANSTSSAQTGLAPGTTYYWKVVAVTEGGVSGATIGTQATAPAGTVISNGTGGGLWSQTSTWAGGVIPTSTDNVTIAGGDLVTEDVTAAAAYTVTVNGTIQYDGVAARTLTVTTDVTVALGGILSTPATGTVTTNVLSVGGNLTNNGTLDFSTNGNTAGAGITFTGSTNNTFGGTGAITNIRTLTIAKGANTNILELNPSNFTVQNTSVDGTPMAFLTLTSGTLKISGTFTLTGRVFTAAAYSIPTAAGFWLNNPNFTVAGQNGTGAVTGLFRLTQGTYNIGTATGNALNMSTGCNVTIEGGALNSTGRFGVSTAAQIINYTQTGGTITVCTIGNASATLGSFDLGTSLSSGISLSGGTVVFQLAATAIDYRDQAGSGSPGVTGGTLQFGNASSGAAKSFNIRGVTPDVVVTNTSANHTATWSTTLVNYNNLSLNVTTNPGATLNFANAVFLFNGTTITNNGIMTHNGASSNFVVFRTDVPVNYTGSGIVTAPMSNLALQCTMGFTIDPASPSITALAVRVFNGNITNANKLIIGNGGATSATVQIGNTTTPTPAGTFDTAPTFNAGTAGTIMSYLRTGGARSTGPEVPATRTITTLTVDENDVTHPLTITGGDLTTTGTFTFTNGIVNLNGSTLTLGLNGSTAALAGALTIATPSAAQYMYNGNFKRWISATTGSRNFPMGKATAKKDISINFTTAPAAGTLTARWSTTAPDFPNAVPLMEGAIVVNSASSQGSWFVDAADGLTGGIYNDTLKAYGSTDILDYTQTVLIKRPSSGGDWILDGTHVTTTGSNATPILVRTGMSGFSEFAIGGLAAVVLPVSMEFFHGSKLGSANYLNWKINVTADAVAVSLERSTDGTNFKPIYSNSATVSSSLNPFDYTDMTPFAGKNYYRLKMTELSGRVTYSSIVVLINGTKGTEIVSIAPTVNDGSFKLNITSVKAAPMTVIITDMTGRVVSKQAVTLTAGFTTVDMNVSNLAAGTYQIYGVTADGKTTAMGFIKK